MGKQLSLLPLMFEFDKDGFIKDTTYWETDVSPEDYHLVFNIETYSLLLPDGKNDWLVKILESESVVITKGSYNGKNDCFEIMFEDDTETPYRLIISDEQFSRISPLKEGCNGHFYIFSGGLYNCNCDFDKVCYRVAETLPFDNSSEKH